MSGMIRSRPGASSSSFMRLRSVGPELIGAVEPNLTRPCTHKLTREVPERLTAKPSATAFKSFQSALKS